MSTAFEIGSLSEMGREQFGSVLHIMRFKAINSTGYGLTFGVHSRINEVMNYVKNNIKVSNVYMNRNTVGAIVGVQPFGRQGKSGTGSKASGPYYMHRLANETLLIDIIKDKYSAEKISDYQTQINKLIK